MIQRQASANPFEFVKVAALRAAQLMRGCIARVPEGHTPAITAQREVAAGKVRAMPRSHGAPEASG
jgi:DNA-directed RNA polymerase subunit K/omega